MGCSLGRDEKNISRKTINKFSNRRDHEVNTNLLYAHFTIIMSIMSTSSVAYNYRFFPVILLTKDTARTTAYQNIIFRNEHINALFVCTDSCVCSN